MVICNILYSSKSEVILKSQMLSLAHFICLYIIANLYIDISEWEGSDEWVRAQFKHYLNSLFSTVIADGMQLC